MTSIKDCGILSHNQTQLKFCSLDKSRSEFMTDMEIMAVNFDNVKTEYLNNIGFPEEKCKSVDAVLEANTKTKGTMVFLIEFKNGRINETEIGLKARDSLLLICDIMDTTIEETRKCFIFVLVYNQDSVRFDVRDKKAIAMSKKEGMPCPFYNLGKMEGVYFRNTLLVEKNDFEKWINKQKRA